MVNETWFSKLPTISFQLNGIMVSLTPHQYIQRYDSYKYDSQYCLAIKSTSLNRVSILGDTFMKTVYTIFDRKNKRIGFVSTSNATISNVEVSPTSSIVVSQLIIIAAASSLGCLCLTTFLIIWLKPKEQRHSLRYYNRLSSDVVERKL